jgi:hypothetical protein
MTEKLQVSHIRKLLPKLVIRLHLSLIKTEFK